MFCLKASHKDDLKYPFDNKIKIFKIMVLLTTTNLSELIS